MTSSVRPLVTSPTSKGSGEGSDAEGCGDALLLAGKKSLVEGELGPVVGDVWLVVGELLPVATPELRGERGEVVVQLEAEVTGGSSLKPPPPSSSSFSSSSSSPKGFRSSCSDFGGSSTSSSSSPKGLLVPLAREDGEGDVLPSEGSCSPSSSPPLTPPEGTRKGGRGGGEGAPLTRRDRAKASPGKWPKRMT